MNAKSKPRFPNSEFLITRAAQCRALAHTFADPTVRDRMVALAADYEELAKSAANLKLEYQGAKARRLI
jgi:hypothetical protein